MAMCGILGTLFANRQELQSSTPLLRDDWLNALSPETHNVGHPECQLQYLNHPTRWIDHCIPESLRPVRILSDGVQIEEPASHIPVLYSWLHMALHWWLCHMWPGWYTDIFDQWEGAWDARTKSATTTMPIQHPFQSQEVPIWSSGDQHSWIYHQLRHDRHWIGLRINHRRIAYSQVN